MEQKKIISDKKWYKFFLIIGLIGLIDIASRQFGGSEFVSIDAGYVSFVVGWIFVQILGNSIGSFIFMVVNVVFNFALIWLIVAYFIYRRVKKEDKTNKDNGKR